MGWVVVESAMCVGLRAPAAAARRRLDRRGSNLSILAERGSIVRSRTENRKKGVGTATGTLILEKAWAGCPCVSVCDRRGNAAAAKGSPRGLHESRRADRWMAVMRRTGCCLLSLHVCVFMPGHICVCLRRGSCIQRRCAPVVGGGLPASGWVLREVCCVSTRKVLFATDSGMNFCGTRLSTRPFVLCLHCTIFAVCLSCM